MRAALIFPPQWDPRQPPLGIPVLAGVLGHAGAEVRVFDLNLSLYRKLIRPSIPGGIEDVLLAQLLDENLLQDAEQYLRVTGEIQKIFDTRFDPRGSFRLFWDTCAGPLSPGISGHWRRAFADPAGLPFLDRIAPEIAAIESWNPDMVCFSIISDTQILFSLALAGTLRKRLPAARLVAGGDAMAYRLSLLSGQEWLQAAFDGIGLGDGEPFLADFVAGVFPGLESAGAAAMLDTSESSIIAQAFPRSPSAGTPTTLETSESRIVTSVFPDSPSAGLSGDVSGCVSGNVSGDLSGGVSGKPSRGRLLLSDLADSPQPTFDSLPLGDYLTPRLVMPVETARGCPWGRCAFCIHPVRGENGRPLYRTRPISAVARNLMDLYACGHRSFFVVDEALPPARLRDVSALFEALPRPVSWICYLRLDPGHTRETFELARASGCRKFFIGLETGSDRILERFHKGITSAVARRVLKDIAAARIAPHLFLMSGFPGETDGDRQQTLALLAEVLPFFDPFGFSYDLFPLTAELETDFLANPGNYGCETVARGPGNDLAYQFPIVTSRKGREEFAVFASRISALADSFLGTAFGLRHAGLAQDSLHLLLIEAHE
ncbi:hypothetical protein AUK22_02780, partial [bacterium CG2_30_54_10]